MGTFFIRTCVKKTEAGQCQRINHDGKSRHERSIPFSRCPPDIQLFSMLGHAVYVMSRAEGISSCVVADMEYPQRVAFALLRSTLDEFETKFGSQCVAAVHLGILFMA